LGHFIQFEDIVVVRRYISLTYYVA